MAYSSLSDAELWAYILNDDFRAFSALFDRYCLVLYKATQRYINNDDECEEVVHDLFLNIWNRKQVLVIEDFNRYLKAAIRYEVLSYIKKHKIKSTLFIDDISELDQRSEFNVADEKISYQELENQLTQHLRQLPKRCREIFILSRMEHLSNLEIAEKLGISKRSVENQITTALQFLRFHMKDIVTICFLIQLFKP